MKYLEQFKKLSLLTQLFLILIGSSALINLPLFFMISSMLKSIEDIEYENLASELDATFSEYFIGQDAYIELNSQASWLWKNTYFNEVLKLKNDYIVMLEEEIDMTPYVESGIRLKNYLEDEYQIPFAYIQAPGQLPSDFDEMIPIGYDNYYNQNADRLLEGLSADGIPVLDLREELQTDGRDHYASFFRTDHHWLPDTGFWATEKIATFIDDIWGIPYRDPFYFQEERYDKVTYPSAFIGSRGARTGVAFAGYDDFTIITPQFDTSLQVKKENSVGDLEIVYQGSFEEVIYPDIDMHDLIYATYMPYVIDEYTVICNENATNSQKIVLLNDSFSHVVACFLVLHYQEVHLVDLRLSPLERSDRLLERIAEINPDIVLQMICAESIYKNDLFSYGDAILRRNTL